MKKLSRLLSSGAIALTTAAAASAASVNVYGLLDYGFSLSRFSGAGEQARNEWQLSEKSGMRNSSRFGLRGSENLAPNWSLSFTLESQFLGDSGDFQTAGILWERESSLTLSSLWGRITVGRVGQLKSPIGTTGLVGTVMNPFGSAMSNFIGAGNKFVTAGNYFPLNNAVTYVTPNIAGWTFHGQYSFANTAEGDYVDADDRYMAAAARYKQGAMTVLLLGDTINKKHEHDISEQPFTVNFGVNYDFGVVKPYFYGQWFRHNALNTAGGYIKAPGAFNGAGAVFALQWPMWGGKAKVGAGYLSAQADHENKNDIKRWSFGLGYDYVVTKTLHWYADAGIMQQNQKTDDSSTHLRGSEFVVGMVKYF